jgi:ubiquitin-conjugating enzyme E2 G1
MRLNNKDLTKSDDLGFSVGLASDSDFFKWDICFQGMPDTLYEVHFI